MQLTHDEITRLSADERRALIAALGTWRTIKGRRQRHMKANAD